MNGSGRIVAVMVIVAMGCGLTIASVFEGTAGRIAENRQALLERSVLSVLPGAVESRDFAPVLDSDVTSGRASAPRGRPCR